MADEVATQVIARLDWHGPMPPPEVLAGYEDVLPGAADRILTMAEKTAAGQAGSEERLVKAEIENAQHGRSLAFILTIVAMMISTGFFIADKPWAGTAFLSMPVVMLIRSFLVARRSRD